MTKTKYYEVVVGNIGQVYSGENKETALKTYATYEELSRTNYGRAAGESVVMFANGEIHYEYMGTIEV